MKICKYCNSKIEGIHSIYANHVRWCDKNKSNGDKGISNISKSKRKIVIKKEYNVGCYRCHKNFNIIEDERKYPSKKRYYCSIKCSNSGRWQIISDETKEIIRIKAVERWKNPIYANKVINNGSSKNKRFTSKGEEEIKKYLKEVYKDDEWTSGGGFKYEDTILTRDMYSNKLKIIVEYDGIWHFKDIHGQLEKKIYKDNLLEKWTIENNWRLIRIKDEIYQKDKKTWMNILINKIYNSTDQIVKLY